MRSSRVWSVATAPSDYIPYKWMLNRLAEHGCASRRTTSHMLTHAEAPPPWITYQTLAAMVVPDKGVTMDVIEASARAAADEARKHRAIEGRAPVAEGAPAAAAASANLPPPWHRMSAKDGVKIVARITNSQPHLIAEPDVANALCIALAMAQLHSDACVQFMKVPTHHVSYRLWKTMIKLACNGAVRDVNVLKRLVAIDTFPLAWTLGGADAASIIVNTFALPANVAYAVLVRHLVPTILYERGLVMPPGTVPLAAPPADLQRAIAEIRAWDCELRGETATRNCSIKLTSSTHQANLIPRMTQAQQLAAAREYFERHRAPPPDAMAALKPQPDVLAFRAFFDVTRHKFSGAGDIALNWRIPWRLLQMLNRTNPEWADTAHPDDASHVADLIITTIARSSNPWHALNFANLVSQRGLVDGVEAALTVLHHAHRGQYAEQAASASRLIFQWLVGPAAIHLNPSRRHQIIPACRVLMKLEMYEELEQLYDLAVQHSAGSDAGMEWLSSRITEVMHDVLCASCGSVLHSMDVTADRQCHACGATVPKKHFALPETSNAAAPSNEAKPSQHQQEAARARRIAARQNLRNRIVASRSPRSASKPPGATPDSASKSALRQSNPFSGSRKDTVTLFREQLLSSDAADVQASSSMPPSSEPIRFVRSAAAPSSESSSSAVAELAVPRKVATQQEVSLNVVPKPRANRPWTCCWCSSKNTATSDPVECSSCGATTGPSAGWRRFRGRAGNDIIGEIRFRINALIAENARDSANADRAAGRLAEEALNIGYLTLLYRRAIFMRARSAAGDYVQLDMLVALLCHYREHVLAAYIFFNLVPAGLRIVNDTMRSLVEAFGQRKVVSDSQLAELVALGDAEKLKLAVVGPSTCGVCFGSHPVHECPIKTRKFSQKTSAKGRRGAASPSQPSDDAEVLRLISAVRAEEPETLYPAYAGFLALADREALARDHSPEVNYLCIMLVKFFFVRRAAMVLCHIPYHLRSTEALMQVCRGFGVEADDAQSMLANRKFGDASALQPNFVQLTKTCCMCFHEQHASHSCPILQFWFYKTLLACASPLASTYHFELPKGEEYQLGGHGQPFAQWSPLAIRTWATTGPERLQAFSKFLISRIDAVSVAGSHSDDLKLAVNMCTTKLAATGVHHQAFRLYAWTPLEMLHRTTTATLLRIRGFSDEIVSQGLQATGAGSDWHLMALPPDACLLCFRTGHGFHSCPELQYLRPEQKWHQVAHLVSSFRVSNVGVLAAAQSLLYEYACGTLTVTRVRDNVELRESIERLARRCFASRLARQGAALLRLLPFEHLTAELHVEMWRAGGKSEDAIKADLPALDRALRTLQDVASGSSRPLLEGTSIGSGPHHASPAPSLYQAQSEFRKSVRASVCTRCMSAGHESVHCPVHIEEVDFGRDLIASFRIPVADERHFEPMVSYTLIMELARFIAKHHRQLPFHIVSVTRAANGIATMLALMDNVPAALRLLLYIPPCFRGEHVFYHILCRFDVEGAEVEKLLQQVFPVTQNPDGSVTRQGLDLETTSSVLRLRPVPDRAVEQVFSRIPNVEDVIKAGEHQLAATDVTDPSQPTAVDPRQWATMEELNEALLPTVEKVEKRAGVAIGSRLISADSVEQLPPLPATEPMPDMLSDSEVPDVGGGATSNTG